MPHSRGAAADHVLLAAMLAYYDHPTPLAFAVASPACRLASESRGVYTLSPHTRGTPASPGELAGTAWTDDAHAEDADLSPPRHRIPSSMLVQPLLKAESYRRLAHTHAGLRVGHTLSVLLLLPACEDEVSVQRIHRWQSQRRRPHDEAALPTCGTPTSPSPARNEDGIPHGSYSPPVNSPWLRVVVIVGETRTAARAVLASTPPLSQSSSDTSAADWSKTEGRGGEGGGSGRARLTDPMNREGGGRLDLPEELSEGEGSVAGNVLVDDWEVEAAAAEAAEARERERRQHAGRGAPPCTPPPPPSTAVAPPQASSTKAGLHLLRTKGQVPQREELPEAWAAPRRVREPLDGRPPPRDTPPPCAWWWGRPQGGTPAHPPLPLSVHMHYGYPRWLDWLAESVDAQALIALSLSSWPYDGRPLRPLRGHVPPSPSLAPTAAMGGGGGGDVLSCHSPLRHYDLPLRAFSYEAGSAVVLADVLRVIAAAHTLEHLRLPYFTSASVLRTVRDAARGLYAGLRAIDVSYGEVSSAGLEELMAVTAAGVDERAAARQPSSPCPTRSCRGPRAGLNSVCHGSHLTQLILAGCSRVTHVDFCVYLPRLRLLDVQWTGVVDTSFDSLLRRFREASGEWVMVGEEVEWAGTEGEQRSAQDSVEGSPTLSSTVWAGACLEELRLCRCNVSMGLAQVALCFPNLLLLDLRSTAVTELGLLAYAEGSSGCVPPLRGPAARAGTDCPLRAIIVDACPQLQSLAPLCSLRALRLVSAEHCPALIHIGAAAAEGEVGGEAYDAAHRTIPSHAPPRPVALTELRLQGCARLGGAALGAMAGWLGAAHLTRLTLDGTAIDDAALRLLCGMTAESPRGHSGGALYPSEGAYQAGGGGAVPVRARRCEALAVLSLRQCRSLRSLGPLGALPSLTTLLAAECGVVDSGLRGLSESDSLQMLDLSHTDVRDIAPLAHMPSLQSLLLRGARRLLDESLMGFVFAPAAARVRGGGEVLLSRHIDSEGCATMTAAPALRHLDLSRCSGLRFVGCLAHLPSLRSLRLDGTPVFDVSLYGFFAGRQALATWHRREEAAGRRERGGPVVGARTGERAMDGPPVDLRGAYEGRIPDLAELHTRLRESANGLLITSTAIAHLREIRLASCAGVRSIEPLGLLPRLRSLDVSGTAVDSAALKGFVWFHVGAVLSMEREEAQGPACGLTYLSLAACKYVTDVDCLAAIPTLRVLDVSASSMEERSLAALVAGRPGHLYSGPSHEGSDSPLSAWANDAAGRLQRPSALQALYLSGCANVRSVQCLLSLPTLRELHLCHMPCTIDEDVVEALREGGVQVTV